jgi:hypothetical protein
MPSTPSLQACPNLAGPISPSEMSEAANQGSLPSYCSRSIAALPFGVTLSNGLALVAGELPLENCLALADEPPLEDWLAP